MPRRPDVTTPGRPDAPPRASHDASMPQHHDATTPRRHDAPTPRRHDAATPRRPAQGERVIAHLADGKLGPHGRGRGAAGCAQIRAGREAVGWRVRGQRPRGVPSERASHSNTGRDPPGPGSAPRPGPRLPSLARAGWRPTGRWGGTRAGRSPPRPPSLREQTLRGVDTNS